MKWADVSRAFEWDGSLRDIYVHDVSIGDWRKFIDFVTASAYDWRYRVAGNVVRGSIDLQAALKFGECSHSLLIDVGGVVAKCHFFVVDQIELDVDPREVGSQEALDQVLGFMRTLGACLGRDVVLTEENAPEDVLLKYNASEGVLRYEATA